jgi:hypothetical protein
MERLKDPMERWCAHGTFDGKDQTFNTRLNALITGKLSINVHVRQYQTFDAFIKRLMCFYQTFDVFIKRLMKTLRPMENSTSNVRCT